MKQWLLVSHSMKRALRHREIDLRSTLLSGSQHDLDSGLADPTGQDFNLYFVSSSSLTQHFLKTIK